MVYVERRVADDALLSKDEAFGSIRNQLCTFREGESGQKEWTWTWETSDVPFLLRKDPKVPILTGHYLTILLWLVVAWTFGVDFYFSSPGFTGLVFLPSSEINIS